MADLRPAKRGSWCDDGEWHCEWPRCNCPRESNESVVGGTPSVLNGQVETPSASNLPPAAPSEKPNAGNDFCRTCGCRFPPDDEDKACRTWEKCQEAQAPQSASEDIESMRVTLGCCLALMAQSGNPGCEEMARRIPFTVKNGEPYALVGVDRRKA